MDRPSEEPVGWIRLPPGSGFVRSVRKVVLFVVVMTPVGWEKPIWFPASK